MPKTSQVGIKRRVMNNMEVIKMSKLFDEHLTQVTSIVGEPLLFLYDEGWDDLRIANETSPDLNREHGRQMRLEYKGELAPEEKLPSATYRDPRCSLLTDRFNALTDLLHANAMLAGEADAFCSDLEKLKITAQDRKDTN